MLLGFYDLIDVGDGRLALAVKVSDHIAGINCSPALRFFHLAFWILCCQCIGAKRPNIKPNNRIA